MASERGTIIGRVAWVEKGRVVDCRQEGSSGRLISANLAGIEHIRHTLGPPSLSADIPGQKLTAPLGCDIRSDARFIIVVEKDAVFQRLSEDRIYDNLPSILITASASFPRLPLHTSPTQSVPPSPLSSRHMPGGYPDLATRALLKRLHEELRLPIVGLFDWNPGGIGVYITYRYGSRTMGLEAHSHGTVQSLPGYGPRCS
jgi:meiotic recombination protein SPO11